MDFINSMLQAEYWTYLCVEISSNNNIETLTQTLQRYQLISIFINFWNDEYQVEIWGGETRKTMTVYIYNNLNILGLNIIISPFLSCNHRQMRLELEKMNSLILLVLRIFSFKEYFSTYFLSCPLEMWRISIN